jgi:hypothetical protein
MTFSLRCSLLGSLMFVLVPSLVHTAELPLVQGVELQPLAAQAKRVTQALELLGAPLTKEQQAALDKAIANTNTDQAIEQIQRVKECSIRSAWSP